MRSSCRERDLDLVDTAQTKLELVPATNHRSAVAATQPRSCCARRAEHTQLSSPAFRDHARKRTSVCQRTPKHRWRQRTGQSESTENLRSEGSLAAECLTRPQADKPCQPARELPAENTTAAWPAGRRTTRSREERVGLSRRQQVKCSGRALSLWGARSGKQCRSPDAGTAHNRAELSTAKRTAGRPLHSQRRRAVQRNVRRGRQQSRCQQLDMRGSRCRRQCNRKCW
jgi:hypothetical protein